MIEFYRFGGNWLIVFSVLACVSVVLQVANIALKYYIESVKGRVCEGVLELSVLAYGFFQTFMLTEVQYHALKGFVIPIEFESVRTVIFAVTAFSGAVTVLRRRLWYPLLCILPQLLTLPFAERALGTLYPAVFLAVLLLFTVRSVYYIAKRYKESRNTVSRSSVKEAIDTLHVGIMFCRPDGTVLLENKQMVKLMLSLTGEQYQDGQSFLKSIREGRVLPVCRRREIGELSAYELADHSVWTFSFSEISVKNKLYTLITAYNQTERWVAANRLFAQKEKLDKRNSELRRVLENIQEVCKSEEMIYAKRRVHDVLGQRISMLIRALRDGSQPEEHLLDSFSDGLPDELRAATEVNPRHVFNTLANAYEALGVELRLKGSFPEDNRVAVAFTDIISESVTNAVRHAYATLVNIELTETENQWGLVITDNGFSPMGEFSEGGGIKSMRMRAERLGGEITVQSKRGWKIELKVPKGEANDKYFDS